jgi:AbiJ N-terminal domain 4
MAVLDTYSKREARRLGKTEDVFQYDDIPIKLRIQIIHILNHSLGSRDDCREHSSVYQAYEILVEMFRSDFGVFCLLPYHEPSNTHPYDEFLEFFTKHATTDQCLDMVEIVFRIVDRSTRRYNYRSTSEYDEIADGAIADLNTRFKENGVGFEWVDGEIIRVDSELLHQEAVKPALALLNTKNYAGPHEEFINAYEHYKSGNNKEALNDCLKAFESTMKAICDKRGWTYDPSKDTANKLIEILFAKGLIPPFWQAQFASLRSLLESSIPTGRNKMSGHGQGATPTEVPDEITAYMLHMTASTLVFLTTAEKALP